MPPLDSPGLHVLERGWLSSNQVVLMDDEATATVVDTGHCRDAAATVALVDRVLAGRRLGRILNTHLHTDHCGGNAALLERYPTAHIHVPAGLWHAAQGWDEAALGYVDLGQRGARFTPHASLAAGHVFQAGGGTWEWLPAPGHDAHALVCFDAGRGWLLSADALWENGFGIAFQALDDHAGFDALAQTLDTLERLDARWVVPGHGTPFTDVAGALQRARQRLHLFQHDASTHARHAAKALLVFHLMEEGGLDEGALAAWLEATPRMQQLHRHSRDPGAPAPWHAGLLAELVQRHLVLHANGAYRVPV